MRLLVRLVLRTFAFVVAMVTFGWIRPRCGLLPPRSTHLGRFEDSLRVEGSIGLAVTDASHLAKLIAEHEAAIANGGTLDCRFDDLPPKARKACEAMHRGRINGLKRALAEVLEALNRLRWEAGVVDGAFIKYWGTVASEYSNRTANPFDGEDGDLLSITEIGEAKRRHEEPPRPGVGADQYAGRPEVVVALAATHARNGNGSNGHGGNGNGGNGKTPAEYMAAMKRIREAGVPVLP